MGENCIWKFVFSLVFVCCPKTVATLASDAMKCSEGTYLHQEGDTSVCLKCPDETFMPRTNHTIQNCFACTVIEDPTTEVLIRPCDIFNNSDIQCVEGYYRRKARNPRDKPVCLKCTEACPKNSFQVQPCEHFHDIRCCEGENFDFDEKNLLCRERPWMCRKGQYLDKGMNDCKPCPENTFMSEDYHSNTKCWDCQYFSEADLPLHAVIIEPCTSTQSPRYGCRNRYYVNHSMSYRGDDIGCFPCQICDKEMHVGRHCDGYHNTVCCDKPNMTVVDGPEGAQCLEAKTCKTGDYNPPACDKSCSQYCRASESPDVSPCDHKSGTCLFGCLEGHAGLLCDIRNDSGACSGSESKGNASEGNDDSAIIIVTVVLVLLVIAIIIIGGMYRKWCPGPGPNTCQCPVVRFSSQHTRETDEDVEQQRPFVEDVPMTETVENRSLEGVKEKVQEIVQALQEIEAYNNVEGIRCQRDMSHIFWDHFEFRKEIGDFLVELKYPDTCMKILRKHLRGEEALAQERVWSVVGNTYSVCRNYTASSENFAKELAKLEAVQFLTSILEEHFFIKNLEGMMESLVIKLSLVGLRLILVYAGKRQDFQDVNFEKALQPLMDSRNESIKFLAMLTMACIQGRENDVKLSNTQEIQELMMETKDDPSISYPKYDQEKEEKIRPIFVKNIIPMDIVHIFHFYHNEVLVQQDIEHVKIATKRGDCNGAGELLTRLSRYDHWYECLIMVLLDPLVNRRDVVAKMKNAIGVPDSVDSADKVQTDER